MAQSQVMGAGLTYAECYGEEAALKVAAVTKLSRNLLLAAVLPYLSYATTTVRGATGPRLSAAELWKHTPGFVLAFLGAVAVRTAGDAGVASSGAAFGLLDQVQWQQVRRRRRRSPAQADHAIRPCSSLAQTLGRPCALALQWRLWASAQEPGRSGASAGLPWCSAAQAACWWAPQEPAPPRSCRTFRARPGVRRSRPWGMACIAAVRGRPRCLPGTRLRRSCPR